MRVRARRSHRIFGGLTAVLLGLSLVPSLASAAPVKTCTDQVLETERRLRIPRGLLLSMALVESGAEGEPSAYALNISGRTVHARNIRDAANFLRDGKGKLRKRVFAGCMQLSVDHHASAFQPVDKIVDPAANVLYAGRMLMRLRNETGSWSEAVGRYNGGSRKQQAGYLCKVWRHVSQLDRANAKLIDSHHCGELEQAAIAPETRRAFRQSQVASTD